MTLRVLGVALLVAAGASAQLQLMTIPGPGLEEPAGEQFDVGSVPSGDIRDTRFRIRNLGDDSIVLERLRITGAGFSLEGNPSLPYTVAPGSNVDFRVRFQPTGYGSYSGTLRINDTYVLIFASSPRTITLSVAGEGGFVPLSSDETVLFDRIEQDASETRTFRIENPAFNAIAVESLEVLGDDFFIEDVPPVPFSIEPGGVLDFTVRFQPSEPGIHQASLWMNDRRFWLEGVGLFPPFPPLEILLDSQVAASGEQRTIGVRLTEPAPADGSGEVRIEFAPAIAGTPDDPAIQFLATGGRTVPFTVRQGEQETDFDGSASAFFQTGTTAGTIHFTVVLGSRIERGELTLTPGLVVVDSASWTSTATGIRLRIDGFDNTRSVSEVSFRFFDTSNHALTSEPLRVDVKSAFSGYFADTEVGGMFALSADFPVAGDSSLLGSAKVRFVNDAGESSVYTVSFR